MDLVFCTEARFVRCSVDLVYSVDGGITNELWNRYLSKFEHIYVMARVLSNENWQVNDKFIASNENVSFIDLPYYVGPLQYFKIRKKLKRKIKENLKTECAYICRVPGEIGNIVATYLNECKRSYGVEVVGDPWDVFSSGAVNHPLRVCFRYMGTYGLKRIVAKAVAALYVTEWKLQLRYPIPNIRFQIAASNVQIDSRKLPSFAKKLQKKDIYNLLSIGSLEQMYKAPDVVLKALFILKNRGIYCQLTWLGEGRYKKQMQDLALKIQVDHEVCFMGNIPHNEVDKELQKNDIFLLVSRTEGLPRALIEAMAMGLPCIGTNVGGIPELLDNQSLIPPNNVIALADKIEHMIKYIDSTNALAKRNFEHAKKYYDFTLQKKREAFYEHLIYTVK